MKGRKLRAGDCIGIISPSDPFNPKYQLQFDRGVRFLEGIGLKVKVAENVLNPNVTPEQKAADINKMFADPEVDGILCSHGGDSAKQCLPHVDFDLIKENPKIIAGLSDNTVVINAIYAKTALITFHAENNGGLGAKKSEYTEKEFSARFLNNTDGRVNTIGEIKTVRGGVVKGKLIGGNTRCLLKLAETEYWPDLRGAILFLESYKATPKKCKEYFAQLRELGAWEKIRGVLIGYIWGLQREKGIEQMEDILLRCTLDFDFPILKVNYFGHGDYNAVMPIGVKARLDADSGTVELLEKALRS